MRPAGIALIGKKLPAKNHGTSASGGAAPTYSSCFSSRAARISATPCMATAMPTTAAAAHAMPDAAVLNVAPRATAAAISATTWNPAIATATDRLPSSIMLRGTGAARRSRCAPLSRSTIIPIPPSTQLSGTNNPMVPTATKLR